MFQLYGIKTQEKHQMKNTRLLNAKKVQTRINKKTSHMTHPLV